MSYQVLIDGGFNGRCSGIIGVSHQFREDRPCFPNRPGYPNRPVFRHYWCLTDECHESVGCHYRISYINPHWIIDIEDANRAVLFKLTWGGL